MQSHRNITAVVATIGQLGDRELIAGLSASVRQHHTVTAEMLAHIGEVDARRLYRGESCSSMFVYCVERLHFSEPAAFRRIHAARVAREFPQILSMVATGQIHLSGIKLLAPHLTETNCAELLADARHTSKREIEGMLARRFPGTPVPDVVRVVRGVVHPIVANSGGVPKRVTTSEPGEPSLFGAPNPPLQRQSPPKEIPEERYAISFTASREVHDKLRQAQDLMRHGEPAGNLAAVFDRALTLLLDDLHRKRFGRRKRPRTRAPQPKPDAETVKQTATRDDDRRRSRHVPNAIKRQVVERDRLRCTFVDEHGLRCSSTGFLELHHQEPFAKGGAHSVHNVTVFCATHNRYVAELELNPGRFNHQP